MLGEDEAGAPRIVPDATPVPLPFLSGAELLAHTHRTGLPISGVMMANECVKRPEAEVRAGLLAIWQVMQECVRRGCEAGGVLPGGLRVRRRARMLRENLERTSDTTDPLYAMEWVTLYALAVNEENAAGGLVQIPCIERNAIASVKAITAARMAIRGDGVHYVSLDKAIKTMRETGADMKDKYKETARGGLAVNVIEC